jgi:hypothetical protein
MSRSDCEGVLLNLMASITVDAMASGVSIGGAAKTTDRLRGLDRTVMRFLLDISGSVHRQQKKLREV